MIKTKAAFRALRTRCGMTQQDVADEMCVRVLSVKRWENADDSSHMPPDDVWDWLVGVRDAIAEEASVAAESAMAMGDEKVVVRYYRTQDELDSVQLSCGRDYPVGVANAIALEAAEIMEREGREVAVVYASRDMEP